MENVLIFRKSVKNRMTTGSKELKSHPTQTRARGTTSSKTQDFHEKLRIFQRRVEGGGGLISANKNGAAYRGIIGLFPRTTQITVRSVYYHFIGDIQRLAVNSLANRVPGT